MILYEMGIFSDGCFLNASYHYADMEQFRRAIYWNDDVERHFGAQLWNAGKLRNIIVIVYEL